MPVRSRQLTLDWLPLKSRPNSQPHFVHFSIEVTKKTGFPLFCCMECRFAWALSLFIFKKCLKYFKLKQKRRLAFRDSHWSPKHKTHPTTFDCTPWRLSGFMLWVLTSFLAILYWNLLRAPSPAAVDTKRLNTVWEKRRVSWAESHSMRNPINQPVGARVAEHASRPGCP